jgi:hypothetical protein
MPPIRILRGAGSDNRLEIMRLISFVLVGLVYCGLAGFFGARAGWTETMAGSFIPYVATPFAAGFLLSGSRVRIIAGAAVGAVSSFCLVIVFYGGSALSSPYSLSTWGIHFWSVGGLVSGAVLGAVARLMRGPTFRSPRVWTAVYCGLLVLAQAAVLLTEMKFDGLDLAVLGLLLVIFCAVLTLAIRVGRDDLRASTAPSLLR